MYEAQKGKARQMDKAGSTRPSAPRTFFRHLAVASVYFHPQRSHGYDLNFVFETTKGLREGRQQYRAWRGNSLDSAWSSRCTLNPQLALGAMPLTIISIL